MTKAWKGLNLGNSGRVYIERNHVVAAGCCLYGLTSGFGGVEGHPSHLPGDIVHCSAGDISLLELGLCHLIQISGELDEDVGVEG